MISYFDVSRETKSTHHGPRPMPRAGILLHSSEGIDSLAWLQGNNPHQTKVASADFLIARTGNIYQLCPLGRCTYHVGMAKWHGFDNQQGALNQLLIGIEMESHETNHPRYTDNQLIVSAALCRRLMMQHFFGVLNIEYHGRIALPPGRRTDPVNFPLYVWTKELLNPSALPDTLVWPSRLP